MTKMKIGVFGALLLILLASAAGAETRYVSDVLVITVRSGMGEEYKILQALETGAPVEVLAEEGRYLKVRTGKGVEGYALQQYISRDLPKALVIERLEKQRSQLQARLSSLEQDLNTQKANLQQAEAERSSTDTALVTAQQELQMVQTRYQELLEKSRQVIELSAERDRLAAENATLTDQVGQLTAENEKLLLSGVIKWFLAGGGVLLVGWIAGKMSRSRKRSSFLS